MPGFSIKINPGWEQEVRKVSLPNAGRKIIQRAFQLSLDKVWKTLINEELPESDFFNDLESGVIAAIFGFTPSMQVKQIEEFKAVFRKKSKTTLIGKDVMSEIVIDKSDIRKPKVRHRIRGSGDGTIEFRWLEVLINGLPSDHINAKILDDIGVEEYVARGSIFPGTLPSGVVGKSRSGHALMVTPDKLPEAMQTGATFRFRIIPNPFLLEDIFGPIQERLGSLLRAEFADRLTRIPPIVIR